jgi:VWFA-related protein
MFPSHRRFLTLVLFFLWLTWTRSAVGETLEVGLINLDVVVSDASGNPVSGLKASDFSLLESGKPQKVISFQAFDGVNPGPPPTVILVIDMLQLPGNLISSELNSVETFLRRNGGHLAAPVRIFTLLESGLWQLAEASRDGNALAAQVAHTTSFQLIRRFQGSPPAALSFTEPPSLIALEALGAIATAERREPGRKLLLWIGPGWGIGSGAFHEGTGPKENTLYTICWFSTLLREARITLHSFSVGETGPSDPYLAYVPGVELAAKASFMSLSRKVLAVQSGGRVLHSSYDLVSQMESCVREAGAFYTLTFDPSPADHPDEWHELKVQIDKQGLTARTNTGYYDQPFYVDRLDPAIRRVTVGELQQLLGANHEDAAAARQLSTVALTERLDTAMLASFTAALHGKKTEQTLTTLADESAFLPPPVAEISGNRPPDPNAQQHMISLVSHYLEQTITRLPDFFAVRTTTHYQDTAQFDAAHRRLEREPMHLARSYKETVLYRNGSEIADTGSQKHHKRNAKDPELITYGTFGPALGFVQDAITTPGALMWSHWEQSPSGVRAVFRYQVPAIQSGLWGCCLPDGDGTTGFQRVVGYHGEITIDPSNGAILRLQAEADIHHFPPVSRSDIMIAYGPVEIGGKTYICPQRSVSIMRTRSLAMLGEWDESFLTYGPWATLVNDISYADYHMFRGESRVMPGFKSDMVNPEPSPQH